MKREDADLLLPFLANETLSGEEKRDVEAAVADDDLLQSDLEALKAIRTTMQAEESFSPGEMGLARLMRDVSVEAQPAATPKPANRTWIWQSVAAVLLVALVGQTAFQMGSPDSAPGGFELASGDTPAVAQSDAVFRVSFMPGTSEADMRSVLIDAGLTITAGPTAEGLYDLSLGDGIELSAAQDALIASSLVDSVEALN
ncbi:MAG: hypothetical protein AAGH60_08455 [Pseudomonadota bacterium]